MVHHSSTSPQNQKWFQPAHVAAHYRFSLPCDTIVLSLRSSTCANRTPQWEGRLTVCATERGSSSNVSSVQFPPIAAWIWAIIFSYLGAVTKVASSVFVPTKTRNCGSRRCRKPQFLLVRPAAHVSNRCKSGIRPVVGRI